MSRSKNSKKYQGQNLVFIVACPRSGTTWLQRMLAASSSRIKTGPETFLFIDYIAPMISTWAENKKKNRPNLHHLLTRSEFREKIRKYTLDLLDPVLKDLKKGEVFLEKTSSHALSLPAIAEIFPESKIINVIRDPRDVVASWLAASRTWAKEDKAKSARELAIFWKDCILATEKFKRSVPPNIFFELRYEALLRETPSTLKETLKFLGIAVSDNHLKKVIAKHQIEKMKKGSGYKRIVIKGEVGGKRGKVWKEPNGFFRKGKVGSWKKDLTFLEKYQVFKETRKLMKKLGYR